MWERTGRCHADEVGTDFSLSNDDVKKTAAFMPLYSEQPSGNRCFDGTSAGGAGRRRGGYGLTLFERNGICLLWGIPGGGSPVRRGAYAVLVLADEGGPPGGRAAGKYPVPAYFGNLGFAAAE